MTNKNRFLVILLLITYALLFSHAAYSSEVCRLHQLQGFEKAWEHAKSLLPFQTTSDPTKAVIYIEKTKEGFYYHSNFKNPGFDYPTKVGSKNLTDASLAFINIVYTEKLSPENWKNTETIFRDKVEILLDTTVFDVDGYPLIDLKGAKNIKIVDGYEGKELTQTGVELLPRKEPPPLVLNKIIGCCLYGIPPHLAKMYGERLKKREFNMENVHLISLVKESGTENAINKSKILSKLRIPKNGTNITDISMIEKSFQQAKGKTVILIGHIEDEHFVTRDSRNNIIFSTKLSIVRTLAEKYQIELIDLGCRTAQEIKGDSLNVGVTTRFNTVEAIDSIHRAISKSKNYEDFFDNLTSEGLKIVIDEKFVNNSSLRSSIYSKVKDQPIWIKVAQLFIQFRS